MASVAFNQLPRKAFRLRLALLLVPVLWIALIGVGVAGFSAANPLTPTTRQGSSPWNPFVPATSFYAIYFNSWQNGPEGCLTGDVHSDFQRGRCTEYFSRMTQASVIAVAPLVVLLMVYLIGMDSLALTYRKIRKKIDSRKAIAKGVVTKPALATNDFYGWLYGFRAISVEVGPKAQIRAYFPKEGKIPLPGDAVALFSTGKALGRVRYYGIYYAPHVAVIAGMTQD